MTHQQVAVAQIGDEIDVVPNAHTAGALGKRTERRPVRSEVVWVQTFRPGMHPMSPIRDDYVARQVATRVGSAWRGHPAGGRYTGKEISADFPSGVSFEHPWAAPQGANGGMPTFTLFSNAPDWPEDGRELGPFTTYDEAYHHAQHWANMTGHEVCVLTDGELLAAFDSGGI
jgi:hypothetical protein